FATKPGKLGPTRFWKQIDPGRNAVTCTHELRLKIRRAESAICNSALLRGFLARPALFSVDQPAFTLDAPAIAGQAAVLADDPVTRDDQANGVRRARSRHRPNGGRRANRSRDLAVGTGLAIGDRLQILPDSPLERRRLNVDRQIQMRAPAAEVPPEGRDPDREVA